MMRTSTTSLATAMSWGGVTRFRAAAWAPTVRLDWRWAAVGIALVVLAGSLLRLIDLGAAPLGEDELNHYYVAAALARGDNPVLPSGEWYLRGLDYTRLVGLALKHTNSIELAVRLPSALLGCLGLLLFALTAWRMAGPWAALYATLLFACYPENINQSRNGRFYSMQMVFGIVALYAGWRALRPSDLASTRHLLRQWGWVAVTGAAFFMAQRLQVVGLAVGLAWGVLVLLAAACDLRAGGTCVVRSSMPVQLSILALGCALAAALLWPGLLPELVARATGVPYWAEAAGFGGINYLDILGYNMPVLIIAGGAALYWVARKHPAGLFLLVWGTLPILLQGLLPWRHGRFILLALPALFLVLGIGAVAFLGKLQQMLQSALARRLPLRLATVAASTVVVLLALGSAAPRALRSSTTLPGWAETKALAGAYPGIPIAHAQPLPGLYHWGRLDFTVSEAARQQWLTAERKRVQLGVEETGGYVWLPMGSADLYTGRPVLSSPDAIRNQFRGESAVLIGLDARRSTMDGVLPELQEILDTEAIELCAGRCGPQRLYLWRLENDHHQSLAREE